MLVPDCPSGTPQSPNLTEEQRASPSRGALSPGQESASPYAPLHLPARPTSERAVTYARTSSEVAHKPRAKGSTATDSGAVLRETPFQLQLFVTNLREATALVVKDVKSFLHNENIPRTWKVVTVGGATLAVVASAAHSLPWGLGALGFVVAKFGGILKENKHNNARGAIQGAILSGHFAGIGADDMATGTGIWAVRMLLQSMIPESRKVLSAAVATTGIGISCAAFCASPTFTAEVALHNLPFAGIILSGIASALPNKWSRTSQGIHLICNSFMLPYHCAISGSWFLAALSVVWGHGNVKNILRPASSETSEKTVEGEPIARES